MRSGRRPRLHARRNGDGRVGPFYARRSCLDAECFSTWAVTRARHCASRWSPVGGSTASGRSSRRRRVRRAFAPWPMIVSRWSTPAGGRQTPRWRSMTRAPFVRAFMRRSLAIEAVERRRFVDAAEWMANHIADDDTVWMKVNVEASEVEILDRLLTANQLGRVDHLVVHFDVEKIRGDRTSAGQMRDRLDAAGVHRWHGASDDAAGTSGQDDVMAAGTATGLLASEGRTFCPSAGVPSSSSTSVALDVCPNASLVQQPGRVEFSSLQPPSDVENWVSNGAGQATDTVAENPGSGRSRWPAEWSRWSSVGQRGPRSPPGEGPAPHHSMIEP